MLNNFFNSAKEAVSNVAEAVNQAAEQERLQREQQEREERDRQLKEQQEREKQQQAAQGGGNFLSSLIGVASEVGRAIGENAQEGASHAKDGAKTAATATKETAEGAAQMTKEDIAKITQGIGTLVEKAAEAWQGPKKEEDIEEAVSKIDSKGGKVQISSVPGEKEPSPITTEKPSEPNFFSGLIDRAKEVGKAIEEKAQEGAQSTKGGAQSVVTGTKETAAGAGQIAKEDIEKISQGIGALIGKAAESFNLTGKKEEPKSTEFSTTPEIDDIEGEIGKVTTGGYTVEKIPIERPTVPSTLQSLASVVTSTALSAGSATANFSQNASKQVSDSASGCYEAAKEVLSAGSAAEASKGAVTSTGCHVANAGATVYCNAKDVLTTVAGIETASTDRAAKASSATSSEGGKATLSSGEIATPTSAGHKVSEATKAACDFEERTVHSPAEAVSSGAAQTPEAGASVYGGSRNVAVSSLETTKGAVISGADYAAHKGTAVIEAGKEALKTAGERVAEIRSEGYTLSKEAVVSVGEGTRNVVTSAAESIASFGVTGYEKGKDTAAMAVEVASNVVNTVANHVTEATSAIYTSKDSAASAAESITDVAKCGEGLAVDAGTFVNESSNGTVNDVVKVIAGAISSGAEFAVDSGSALYTKSKDAVVSSVDSTRGEISSLADKIVDFSATILEAGEEKVVTVAEFSKEAVETGAGHASAAGGEVCDDAKNALGSVAGAIASGISNASYAGSVVLEKGIHGTNSTKEVVQEKLSCAAESAYDTVESATETTEEFVTSGAEHVVDEAEKVADGAKNIVNVTTDVVFKAGEAIGNALGNMKRQDSK